MNYLSPLFRKHGLLLLCLLITVGILVVGLWPFNFHQENKVKWLPDGPGICFYGQGIAYSQRPIANLFQNGALSIEILVQPELEPNHSIPRILSFSDEAGSENFFLGQWKSSLIIRKRAPQSVRGYKEIGLRNALLAGQNQLITMTSDRKGTSVYLNGLLKKFFPNYSPMPSNKKVATTLSLGNSPSGKEFWSGSLLGFAIYNHILLPEQISHHAKKWYERDAINLLGEEGLVALFTFDEGSGIIARDTSNGNHLLMPPMFRAIKKQVLVSPWKDFSLSRSYLMDILTNILGFIPFGFFFSGYLWLKKPSSIYRILLISILLAGCISLSIELIQVYLPTRSSQLTDVITNTLGAALGVILFSNYQRRSIQYFFKV